MTHTLTLHVSGEMAEALSLVAKSEDATLGEIVRDAIRRDLQRRAIAKKTQGEQRRAFDPLRKLLQSDFERAQDWQHLQSRLMDKGYRLLQGHGDVMIHRASGELICRLSDLGQNQVALARRFQAPFGTGQEAPQTPRALAS